MHPLKTNMHLATAAAARAWGGVTSQDEEEQLQYADMLIDVSMNRNSAQCHVIQDADENISVLGLPLMKYYTEPPSLNTVSLRRISFFSEIRSPWSVTPFFCQNAPFPPKSNKTAPAAKPLSACSICNNVKYHMFLFFMFSGMLH